MFVSLSYPLWQPEPATTTSLALSLTSQVEAINFFFKYDYDGNAVLTQPIKNRQAATIYHAWLSLHQVLQRSGNAPNLYIMDNEAFSDMKDSMTKHKINFQLAPPHIHRHNAAERAIRTFKNQFVAGLSTTDPNFPVECSKSL